MAHEPTPSASERFYSYMCRLNTPKRGELRRVFEQIVGEMEAENAKLRERISQLEDCNRIQRETLHCCEFKSNAKTYTTAQEMHDDIVSPFDV